MKISLTLTPEQEAWLAAHIAQGQFASAEDGIRHLLDAGIAGDAELEADDLAWAQPYVTEALAEIERGMEIPVEKHDAHIDALMAKLGR